MFLDFKLALILLHEEVNVLRIVRSNEQGLGRHKEKGEICFKT